MKRDGWHYPLLLSCYSSAALAHESVFPVAAFLGANTQVVEQRADKIGRQKKDIGYGQCAHDPREFSGGIEGHEDEEAQES